MYTFKYYYIYDKNPKIHAVLIKNFQNFLPVIEAPSLCMIATATPDCLYGRRRQMFPLLQLRNTGYLHAKVPPEFRDNTLQVAGPYRKCFNFFLGYNISSRDG